MIDFIPKPKVNLQPREHDYYVELCALASSGILTDQEWAELGSHLAECGDCKELVQKYRELGKTGMSLLTPDASLDELPPQKSWSPELVKQELFARLARGETSGQYHLRAQQNASHRDNWFWQYLAVPRARTLLAYSAGIALVAASLVIAYRIGHNSGRETARAEAQSFTSEVTSLRAQLKDLLQERASLNERLEARDEGIVSLSREVQRQIAEVAKWKNLESHGQLDIQQQTSEIGKLRSEKDAIAAEQDAASRRLQEAQAALASTQRRLNALHEERAAELLDSATLETHIEELSARLKESEQRVRQQESLLAADRDIRELMGARQLYIADVFDVDDSGRMRKPFGRMFYTRQKSLIFYAFDLNKQPGVRNASIFQAWGRRGPTDKQPLSLGILYLDNEANKRWVLKFDDPRVLAQIDAVFVTVEPRGGSRKPSGKQLLFASLRTPANHP